MPQVDKALLGHDIIMRSAPEPSDIIWENLHVSENQRKCRSAIVFVISAIFLLGMFFLFVWMKSLAVKNMLRYPQTLNCDSVATIF